MQEYKVTLDGQTLPLDKPFMVIATQNPIEFQGTYPLPETQIDRFLMKIEMGYLGVEEEVQVLNAQEKTHPIETIQQVSSIEQIRAIQEKVKEIEISEKVLTYIARLVSSTRTTANITLGASTRASIALMNSARVWALLEGRNYVIPDDVYHLSYWVLRHRVLIDPKAAMEGISVKDIISDLLNQTAIS
jgi:MoxR-like ATPase